VKVHGYSADGKWESLGCCLVNCNSTHEIYSFHAGGANVLRADGSVQFMKETIAPAVLLGLISYAGGEVVSGD
jgi:prepilin-type processing-associated H-X9-DG protein